jgi:hypothetical protein
MPQFSFSRLFALAALLAGTVSCSKSDTALSDDVITANNFEAVSGWFPAPPSLTRDKAHSGHYSIKVDKDVEYGMGYSQLMSLASPTRLQKIKVSGWAMLSGPDAKATLIVQITDPANPTAKPLYWQPLELNKVIKKMNDWTEFTQEFSLPANITPTQQLWVYLWRGAPSTQAVYMDDLAVTKI